MMAGPIWPVEVLKGSSEEPSAAVIELMGDGSTGVRIREPDGNIIWESPEFGADVAAAERCLEDVGLVVGANVFAPGSIRSGMTGWVCCYLPPRWRFPLPSLDLVDSFGPYPTATVARKNVRGFEVPAAAKSLATSLVSKRIDMSHPNPESLNWGLKQYKGQSRLVEGGIYALRSRRGDSFFLRVDQIGSVTVDVRFFSFSVHSDRYVPESLIRVAEFADRLIRVVPEVILPNMQLVGRSSSSTDPPGDAAREDSNVLRSTADLCDWLVNEYAVLLW